MKFLLVYDDACNVCTASVQVSIRLGLLRKEMTRGYRELDENTAAQIDFNSFRNEMAVINQDTGQVLYGFDGLAAILREKSVVFRFLLGIPLLMPIARLVYRTVSYNRFVISPPAPRLFSCDCEPVLHNGYRFSYIAFTFLYAIVITALLAMPLYHISNGFGWMQDTMTQYAPLALTLCGLPWVFQTLAILIARPERWLDYIGHLGSIMALGVTVLIPAIIYSLFTGCCVSGVLGISILCSFILMNIQHLKRLKFLQLSKWWYALWLFLMLLCPAILLFLLNYGGWII